MSVPMTKPIVHELSPDDDERILCDVMRQIIWQADISAEDLRLSVGNGIVRLLGSVETCVERIEAENAARAVYGVGAVMNDLAITPRHHHDDEEIAREIEYAFLARNSVLEQPVEVRVSDGIAVLRGSCRWQFQKSCAERVALSTIGVRRVVNRITVQPSSITVTVPHSLDAMATAS